MSQFEALADLHRDAVLPYEYAGSSNLLVFLNPSTRSFSLYFEILSIDRAALLAKLAESLTLTVQLRIKGSCVTSVVSCLLAAVLSSKPA